MVVNCFQSNGNFLLNLSGNPFSSYGFQFTKTPFFCMAFNVMNAKKIRISYVGSVNASLKGGSNTGLVNDGIFEKELEFKPSFDEYLKAMESVKTARDKKQTSSMKPPKERGSSRRQRLGGDEENALQGKSEGPMVQQDGLLKDADTTMRKDGMFRLKKQANSMNKQKMKERSISKPRLERDGKNTKLGKSQVYMTRQNVSEHEGLVKDSHRTMGREGLLRGEGKYKRNEIKRLKNEYNGNEKGLDGMVKRYQGAETKEIRWSKYQTSNSGVQVDSSNLVEREARAEGDSTALMDSDRNDNHGSIIEEGLVHDAVSVMLGKNVISNSERHYKSMRKSLGRDKIGDRSRIEMHGRLRRWKTENITDEKGQENFNLTINNKFAVNRVDNYDDLEVERAAFKTVDEFDNITSKPPVSRMEMEERIQKLAKMLNGANIDMPEWIFSKMMRSAKIKFTDHSILRVIQILGKLGNWRRVLQVIEWLQMRERFKSHKLRFVYTAALDALGKARRPVEAFNLFHAMLQQMSSYPDLVAYHSIAVTLGQAGHVKELFDVIDIMQSPPKKKFKTGALGKWDPRLEPDIVVYNSVLNACVQRKQWEGAFWVLQQLKLQGQRPSSTTYGLVMEVMLSCGKYNLVHDFFRKVQKSSIPNALTYKVLVNTLWKEGKADEAVLAVQDMERRGIVGSAALYYDLARCLCSAGRCHEALMQIQKICAVASKPLVVTYTGLIQACLDSGNILDGAYIFKQMEDICSPNLITCNIMLKAYLEHGMFEEAKELFQKMSRTANHISQTSDYKIRVIPDIYTFNTMLDACMEDKRWDDFEYIYLRMLQHGYHFNAKRHLRMILEASKAGKVKPLETTWKHFDKTDRVPPSPLIKERFCVKLEKDDCVAALACISSNLLKELQGFSKMSWLNLFKENARRFKKDTLIQLIHEVRTFISRNDLWDPVLRNLVESCKEFCETDLSTADPELIQTACTVE
ncbi:putative Pentatricopeptide repeat-containing protein [Quillaja saponaria]|uniref:Pentatricopeptide repeat-containing protein n=1 Tax=Quillaja saponaria TaxID=32244 RepID=A0AAD7PVW2_QUISA|nr:putative Pentatricopeptide repeat-containing protein [Quillaja saponaria]